MKAIDFYECLNGKETIILENSFHKQKNGLYIFSDRYKMEFILNKWGWDSENGWAFLVRMTDTSAADEYGNVIGDDDTIDIRAESLIENGHLNSKQLDNLYSNYPHELENSRLEDMWYAFMDKQGLSSMLDTVLPGIVNEAVKWANDKTTQAA